MDVMHIYLYVPSGGKSSDAGGEECGELRPLRPQEDDGGCRLLAVLLFQLLLLPTFCFTCACRFADEMPMIELYLCVRVRKYTYCVIYALPVLHRRYLMKIYKQWNLYLLFSDGGGPLPSSLSSGGGSSSSSDGGSISSSSEGGGEMEASESLCRRREQISFKVN